MSLFSIFSPFYYETIWRGGLIKLLARALLGCMRTKMNTNITIEPEGSQYDYIVCGFVFPKFSMQPVWWNAVEAPQAQSLQHVSPKTQTLQFYSLKLDNTTLCSRTPSWLVDGKQSFVFLQHNLIMIGLKISIPRQTGISSPSRALEQMGGKWKLVVGNSLGVRVVSMVHCASEELNKITMIGIFQDGVERKCLGTWKRLARDE